MSSAKILWKEFRNITNPKTGLKQIHVEVADDNIYIWNVSLMVVDPESHYNGACLQGILRFSPNYPFEPPSFKFTPAIFHPNVYVDGRLCISILHSANSEQPNDEPLELTWSPAQNVETVLLSILSLLDDPNINSPANVEASVGYKKRREEYIEHVKKDVQRSKERMPKDIVMPTLEEVMHHGKPVAEEQQEEGWWEDDYYDDDEDDDEDDDDEEEEDEDEEDDNVDDEWSDRRLWKAIPHSLLP